MKCLVKKAMAGNKDAFAQLMEMNAQSMYKVARAYFTSDADVYLSVLHKTLRSMLKMHNFS